MYLREEESTTGIGEGIAIPHGKCDAVKKPGLAAMVVKTAWNLRHWMMSRLPFFFLIAAPNTEDNIHLDVLSKLSVMLMDDNFTESLRNAGSVDEFMEIIDKADEEKKILMKDWQIQEVPKEPELNCWQLLFAPQVLPTPTWQQRDWKKQQRRKTVSLK